MKTVGHHKAFWKELEMPSCPFTTVIPRMREIPHVAAPRDFEQPNPVIASQRDARSASYDVQSHIGE